MPLGACDCRRCDGRDYPNRFPHDHGHQRNPRGVKHPDAARHPAYGSVRKIARTGDRAVRLLQLGVAAHLRYIIEQLGPEGELLQAHRTTDFVVALTIYRALAGGEAIAR